MSIETKAASAPAYAMFFIRMRSRAPLKASTHIFPKGTPRNVTSSLIRALSIGQDES